MTFDGVFSSELSKTAYLSTNQRATIHSIIVKVDRQKKLLQLSSSWQKGRANLRSYDRAAVRNKNDAT